MNADPSESAPADDATEPGKAESTGKADPTVERAEQLVDEVGERLGYFASIAGQRLRKFAARAREEGEDMWAEAQHMRNGSKGEDVKPDP
jgi:hypothetical protein